MKKWKFKYRQRWNKLIFKMSYISLLRVMKENLACSHTLRFYITWQCYTYWTAGFLFNTQNEYEKVHYYQFKINHQRKTFLLHSESREKSQNFQHLCTSIIWHIYMLCPKYCKVLLGTYSSLRGVTLTKKPRTDGLADGSKTLPLQLYTYLPKLRTSD